VRRKAAALCAAAATALILAGCASPPTDQRARNPAKYDRDHATCQAEVDEYVRSHRNADISRRGVFQDDRDRVGRGALPAEMDAYTDSRSTDRVMEDCMARLGWPQPHKQWWEKIGGGSIRI
jgi:hypothetical protein